MDRGDFVMTTIDNGGSAFPEAIAIGPAGDVYPGFPGMTLRDWFAAQAIGPLLGEMGGTVPSKTPRGMVYDLMASQAYQMADAVLAERSK